MADRARLDIVTVEALHERLGFSTPIDYPIDSRHRAFSDWRMEVDDAPILRYLYRSFRPRRHLEFGAWEGTGTCYCLEECDATVWTINLPNGETVGGRPAYVSSPAMMPPTAVPIARKGDHNAVQTDAGAFIGHRYRDAGLGHRVCQIYCDSRDWDTSTYPPGFFDSALIDGGHSPDLVASDTDKALSVVRAGSFSGTTSVPTRPCSASSPR